jgi:hypothetical protein
MPASANAKLAAVIAVLQQQNKNKKKRKQTNDTKKVCSEKGGKKNRNSRSRERERRIPDHSNGNPKKTQQKQKTKPTIGTQADCRRSPHRECTHQWHSSDTVPTVRQLPVLAAAVYTRPSLPHPVLMNIQKKVHDSE